MEVEERARIWLKEDVGVVVAQLRDEPQHGGLGCRRSRRDLNYVASGHHGRTGDGGGADPGPGLTFLWAWTVLYWGLFPVQRFGEPVLQLHSFDS